MNVKLLKHLNQTVVAIFFVSLCLACKTNKLILDKKNSLNDVNVYVAGYEVSSKGLPTLFFIL